MGREGQRLTHLWGRSGAGRVQGRGREGGRLKEQSTLSVPGSVFCLKSQPPVLWRYYPPVLPPLPPFPSRLTVTSSHCSRLYAFPLQSTVMSLQA